MVSEFLSSISNLTSKITSMIQGSSAESSIAREIEKLGNMISRIRTVLADSEEGEIMDLSEKLWLCEIREVSYDAEDILSDFNYNRCDKEIGHLHRAKSRKRKLEVTDLTFSAWYDSSLLSRIQKVTERYHEICQARDIFCLCEEDGIRKFQSCSRPPSSSFLDPSGIVGREAEARAIIDALSIILGIKVVALVGMAGIGKTTVTKLVSNHGVVQTQFQLKGWVWVSPFYDEVTITKLIIESFTYEECGLCELDALEQRLIKVLAGKKFFLVLNNIQDVNSGQWKVLRWLHTYGGDSSCILITTENSAVAKSMGANPSIPLDPLSGRDSWALFSHHAFNKRNSTMIPEKLMEIAQKLVDKCSGVPLVVRALGSLVSFSTEEKTWEYILQSNVWDLEECKNDMNILSLSYHVLPAHLKPCFRSCAMFPKGHVFEADSLVRIWAAQGLIQAEDRKEIEVGHTYVNDLIQRSFLQYRVVQGIRQTKPKIMMHDLMHDLSTWIVGGETAIIENKVIGNRNYKDFRYKSSLTHNLDIGLASLPYLNKENGDFRNLTVIVKKDGQIRFETFQSCRPLKSLFIYSYNQTSFDLEHHFFNFSYLQFLHVLDLNFWKAVELPESIGNFRHLRFLGLSGQSLPDSICNCMQNLRHLEFSPWDVKMMPIGIGSMTNLQSLSAFAGTSYSSLEHFC